MTTMLMLLMKKLMAMVMILMLAVAMSDVKTPAIDSNAHDAGDDSDDVDIDTCYRCRYGIGMCVDVVVVVPGCW